MSQESSVKNHSPSKSLEEKRTTTRRGTGFSPSTSPIGRSPLSVRMKEAASTSCSLDYNLQQAWRYVQIAWRTAISRTFTIEFRMEVVKLVLEHRLLLGAPAQ